MIRLKHPPLKNMIVTSPFGMRDFSDMWWHNGIDLKAEIGTPVYAVSDGVVEVAKNNPNGYGLYVVLDHTNWGTLYAHLNNIKVVLKQRVKAGDVIGYGGNTGLSTGPHLHFEIRLGDYFKHFWERSKCDSKVYMRCIDPQPYIQDLIDDSNMTVEQAKALVQKEIGYDNNTMEYLTKYYKYSDSMILKMARALK